MYLIKGRPISVISGDYLLSFFYNFTFLNVNLVYNNKYINTVSEIFIKLSYYKLSYILRQDIFRMSLGEKTSHNCAVIKLLLTHGTSNKNRF